MCSRTPFDFRQLNCGFVFVGIWKHGKTCFISKHHPLVSSNRTSTLDTVCVALHLPPPPLVSMLLLRLTLPMLLRWLPPSFAGRLRAHSGRELGGNRCTEQPVLGGYRCGGFTRATPPSGAALRRHSRCALPQVIFYSSRRRLIIYVKLASKIRALHAYKPCALGGVRFYKPRGRVFNALGRHSLGSIRRMCGRTSTALVSCLRVATAM